MFKLGDIGVSYNAEDNRPIKEILLFSKEEETRSILVSSSHCLDIEKSISEDNEKLREKLGNTGG